MDLTSLRILLRPGKPTSAEYAKSLQTFLDGISHSSAGGSADELVSFQASMFELSTRINEYTNVTDMESTVSAALEVVRAYLRRTTEFSAIHISELKAVIRTLTETVTYLSESRTRSVHQMKFIEHELEEASELEDIRLLRGRLTGCLEIVKQEAARLQTESTARFDAVRSQLEIALKPEEPAASLGRSFGSMDSVTGLPGRSIAEKVIGERLATGQDSAYALFVVNRLAAINARYGRPVGDQAMLLAANHFSRHLSASTSLFRWGGPSLVAIVHIENNFDEVKRLCTKIASAKLELNVDSKQRELLVPVDSLVMIERMIPGTSPESIFTSLDHFVDTTVSNRAAQT